MNVDKIVSNYLRQNPPTEEKLPNGCEKRFGIVGKFCKYTSAQHAESRNLYNGIPFGGCNYSWNELVSNLQDGDEIWKVGYACDGAVVVYLIRNNDIVYENYGNSKYPRRGYCVYLSVS